MLGNLLGKLTSSLGGSQQFAKARRGYPSALQLADGDAAFDTFAEVNALLPAAGAVNRIWEFTVPAQVAYAWGFGSPLTPANQGYWWFCFLDSGTDFTVGVVTLGYENGTRHNYIPVEEKADVALHTATVTTLATATPINREEMQALPQGGSQGVPAIVGQDSRLVIDYRMITVATAEDAGGFMIPVTIFD